MTPPTTIHTAIRPLSPVEARILSTLMEKARTVPDTYPMTLNALLSGCNQKTSREPVMNLAESEVVAALEELRELGLVTETSGGRAARFGHQFQKAYGVPEQSAVLVGLLMLRGPQTAGELRLNAERWYRFADISSVEGFLDELQERSAEKGGALVLKLPRAPGAREQRWAHLLCGPVDVDALGASAPSAGGAAAHDRIAALEAEVAALRATLERVCSELGLSPSGQ
ncbi:MAG TPA: YceH family protein [Burkholderiaceae bacterium]|nr:YceH family protein [Burkholderiaceae bacterium]